MTICNVFSVFQFLSQFSPIKIYHRPSPCYHMEQTPQFGTRYLTDLERAFEHNSWDNVALSQEDISNAQTVIQKQKESSC